jgi:hypothetical protein
MRINLVTPFAEKDAVKALGARWDAAKKLWYITDVADLTPFARWIPELAAAQAAPSGPASLPGFGPTAAPRPRAASQAVINVPHCGCNVLPWDDCVHSLAQRPTPSSTAFPGSIQA